MNLELTSTKTKVKPIILVAKKRSGTWLLGYTLASNKDITSCGEVFFKSDSPFCWFNYLESQRQNSENESQDTQLLFDEYLAYLARENQKKNGVDKDYALLDIKYEVFNTLESNQKSSLDDSCFRQIILERKIPVIHLIRKNVLRAFVSYEMAKQTNTWRLRVKKGESQPDTSITIDCSSLVSELETREQEISDFKQAFSGYENYLELYYKELTEDGKFSESCLKKVVNLVDVDLGFNRKPLLAKQGAKDLSESIDNWSEVEATLKDTKYESMLSDK